MDAATKKCFLDGHDFHFDRSVFWQTRFQGNREFTEAYLKLRNGEGRLYYDATVLGLPKISADSPTRKEWTMRKRSADRLIKYLRKKNFQTIVELGCGNGWLINYMSKSLHADFYGLDINAIELEQAARLFGNEKVKFAFGDINSESLTDLRTDSFILAGAVQYFPDLKHLISRLLSLLNAKGEIHILDSPFYNSENWAAAKTRSGRHFEKFGSPRMKEYYYYQKWESMKSFHCEVLYDPSSLIGLLTRAVNTYSPFPWIRIINQ